MTISRIFAVSVDKGGVGKTTTALNLAAYLAQSGQNVLLVDADQQANLTHVFCRNTPEYTLYDALIDEAVPLPILTIKDNLSLVPASPKMFGIGIRLVAAQTRATLSGAPVLDCRGILARKLKSVVNDYDIVIIDCPPSDNILTINALYAATDVIIVANPEPFCLEGVLNFGKILRIVKNDVNKNLRLAGVLITNYETGSVGHQKAEAELRSWAPKYVYITHIRRSRPLYNAALAHQDIFSFAPESNGALDYKAFAEEFIQKLK